jgi:hypothetical protein
MCGCTYFSHSVTRTRRSGFPLAPNRGSQGGGPGRHSGIRYPNTRPNPYVFWSISTECSPESGIFYRRTRRAGWIQQSKGSTCRCLSSDSSHLVYAESLLYISSRPAGPSSQCEREVHPSLHKLASRASVARAQTSASGVTAFAKAINIQVTMT